MNSPLSSPDRLADLVRQIAGLLAAAAAEPARTAPVLGLAQELEHLSLETGQPLLAGAAICVQQRMQEFIDGVAPAEELPGLAQAWADHAPSLLGTAGNTALEEGWLKLQAHLTPRIDPASALPDEEFSIPAPPADEPAVEPIDADAFLNSLDQPAEEDATPAPSAPSVPVPSPAEPPPAVADVPEPAPAPAEEPAEEIIPPEILEAFSQESREAFEAMEQSIMAWEKNGQQREDLRNVFRLAHSVKGAANSVGLRTVGTVLHRLEDMLEDLVEERGHVSVPSLSALILSLIDTLRSALASGESATPAWKGTADTLVTRIATLRDSMEPGPAEPAAAPVVAPEPVRQEEPAGAAEPAPAAAADPKPAAEAATPAINRAEHSTIRVDTAHLDSLMNLVGDLLINRHRLNRKLQQVTSLRAELVRARERLLHVVGDFNSRYEFSQRRANSGAQSASDGFTDLELDRYDDFNILSRSLVEIAADAEEIVTQIDGHFGSFSEEAVQFTTVTRQLQEEVARTRMVPLDQLFRRLNRAVRDACASEGKTVRFVVEGADNRVDKFISDQLFRPLLHIVRNAVAHGIEGAAERRAAGKPAEGRLLVRSRTEAGRLVLEFIDDGSGLRRDAIIRVARARGLLGEKASPDDNQLAELIFQPGFSTAAETTDVSGRGIGLDVVRQELTNLGGTVSVVSRPGQGCSFVLTLPVTLAINQVMFVQCSGRVYALPINFVERVVAAPRSAFRLSGGSEVLMLDDRQTMPVVRLHGRLGLPDASQASTAIVLTLADRRTALVVDRIQSKIDIVVKPLGPLLNRHPYFSGATLAGDGRVIFILDVPGLIAPGATRTRTPLPAPVPEAEPAGNSRKILVVDDSLSIRRIAANYLTGAHFEVDTAVDGSEALEKLREDDYALVVSDLEMPRVNGFELIAEMRRHPKLQRIPVIILTSRDAAKHRERARQLGAADYLIKPVSREQLTSAVGAFLAPGSAAA